MERKNKINFWLTFIKNLIIINPGRFVMLIAFLLCLGSLTLIPDMTEFGEVHRYFVDGNTHYYQMYGGEVLEFKSEQKIFVQNGDSFLKVKTIHPVSIISITLAVVNLIFLIAACFIEDLEIKNVTQRTIMDGLKEHEIGSLSQYRYYYTSYNKLVYKSNTQYDFDDIPIYKFKELKKFLNLENFYTKAELREVKLRKLGI
jgi:hypothetical protein